MKPQEAVRLVRRHGPPGTYERSHAVDLKLEVVVLPVADVDRAKNFYTGLGWREDGDFVTSADFRVVQLTPPGSDCSVIFGTGVTSAVPGSADGLVLVVDDIETARAELADGGAEVGEVFHDMNCGFYRAGDAARIAGPAPGHQSYASFASFSDPDGNQWFLQEITTRLPGRVPPERVVYDSTADLAEALGRAAAAHGKHEEQTGQADAAWPEWYARYMVDERNAHLTAA
jgi:catechol 2,3-dioxygenase-like lactoylglutathione lyase family enzyme